MKQSNTEVINQTQRLKLVMLTVLLVAALLSSGCMSALAAKPVAKEATQEERVDKAQTMLASADAAWRAGDDDRALMEYVTAMQLDPDNAVIRYRIAVLQDRRGDVQAAQRSYADVLRLEPDHAGAHEGMGLALLKQQQLDKANMHLQQSVARDNRRWRAYNGLGVIADLQRRPGDAIAFYHQAVTLQPQMSMLHSNLGYSSYLDGDYRMALVHLERALKTDPNNQTAWANMALVNVRLGDGDRSVRAFTEFMEPYRAHNNVGYLFYMNGDESKAETHLKQAIDLSPSYYALARHNLDRLGESY